MSQDIKNTDNISAVILSGDTDFGRCPLASRLQRSVWPLAESSVLGNLIEHIAKYRIDQLVICCQGSSQNIRKILNIPQNLKVRFHEDPLPAGSAGSIRDAARICDGQLLVVFHAAMLVPPDIDDMIAAHASSHADMTVLFNPPDEKGSFLDSNGQVYVCNRSLVEYIPKHGYSDIKEGLIPVLLREGKIVRAVCAADNVGNFLSWRQYLDASVNYVAYVTGDRTQNEKYGSDENVCLSENTTIHPTARVFGPAVICKGAVLKSDSVLLGPAIVGQNAVIEENAVVSESVLWDNSRIGRNACLDRCLVDSGAYVPENSFIKDDLIVRNFHPILSGLEVISHAADGIKQKISASLQMFQRNAEKYLPLRSNPTSPMKNPLIIVASILLFIVFIAT
jgi:NDP-sugar pyrophosphorylase family protein